MNRGIDYFKRWKKHQRELMFQDEKIGMSAPLRALCRMVHGKEKLRRIGLEVSEYSYGYTEISHSSWVDHAWYLNCKRIPSAFISEPYDLTEETKKMLELGCGLLGLDVIFSTASTWCPGGGCYSILIQPTYQAKQLRQILIDKFERAHKHEKE